MKKVAFYTLGCRVNQYETQAMKEIFIKKGYEICQYSEKADVYVVNSCTVTATGDKKSRQALSRAKKQNPDAITILAGCYAQKITPDEARRLNADIILGNNEKQNVAEIVEKRVEEKQIFVVKDLKDAPYCDMNLESYEEKTRAMIKIEDGCDRFCSYCIIPYVRGPVRCRPFDEIISEAERLSENGFKEVVVTGIQTAAYKWDGLTLKDVVVKISEVAGIERIRLGSLEPVIITDEFLSAMKETGKLCPTFHLSLQSGSDSVLRRMNRRYNTAIYKEKIEKIMEYFPYAAITTDVIAGFPQETETEHRESVEFAGKIGFAHMHVFPYSPREGTKAALLDGQLEKSLKEKRTRELNELSEKMHKEFIEKNMGKTYPVLFEQLTKDGRYEGLTPNYITVKVKSDTDIRGVIKEITLCEDNIK
ncbi:MAG: tRNA (N(6)-L-threonylcarbamoyladenosine(37)-C(2))-methylthiotransferase MtaB [Clostridia bacterium]|nr:tRNA (N(6)-L-threonylcarbamoyladenosine(37)-C(2))-methylthiotransferase MtaB [Clostridia bacterium]